MNIADEGEGKCLRVYVAVSGSGPTAGQGEKKKWKHSISFPPIGEEKPLSSVCWTVYGKDGNVLAHSPFLVRADEKWVSGRSLEGAVEALSHPAVPDGAMVKLFLTEDAVLSPLTNSTTAERRSRNYHRPTGKKTPYANSDGLRAYDDIIDRKQLTVEASRPTKAEDLKRWEGCQADAGDKRTHNGRRPSAYGT